LRSSIQRRIVSWSVVVLAAPLERAAPLEPAEVFDRDERELALAFAGDLPLERIGMATSLLLNNIVATSLQKTRPPLWMRQILTQHFAR